MHLTRKTLSPRILSLLKYGFAFVLLAMVLHQAGTRNVAEYLGRVSPSHWVLALILVTIAQFFSILRIQYFFRAAGFSLSIRYAVALSYVGAFYNFILPSGVGGDAYKVLLLRRRLEMPAALGIRIMLADRASGLCILIMVALAALSFMDLSRLAHDADLLLCLAALIVFMVYLLISKWLLKQPFLIMTGSLLYSLGVQLSLVSAMAIIWLSVGHHQALCEYIALYGAAGITGTLPVSVGGLGLKEATYFYGAPLIQQYTGVAVEPGVGVAMSLCLFMIMLVATLPSLLWLDKVNHMEYAPRAA